MKAKFVSCKISLSKRAVIQRIQRKLAKRGQMLRTYRRTLLPFHGAGDFCVIDLSRNEVIDTQSDLEAFAKELGVIQEYEILN
jgi:hypothetical protein